MVMLVGVKNTPPAGLAVRATETPPAGAGTLRVSVPVMVRVIPTPVALKVTPIEGVTTFTTAAPG